MLRRLKHRWMAWRLKPGLKIATDVAYLRSWGNQNTPMLGQEQNLGNLANDLSAFRMRLEADQECLGPEFEKVLSDHAWDLYLRAD